MTNLRTVVTLSYTLHLYPHTANTAFKSITKLQGDRPKVKLTT